MKRDRRVGIEAFGGDVAEYRVQRAPDGGAFLRTFRRESRNGARGDGTGEFAVFLVQLRCETAGVFGAHK